VKIKNIKFLSTIIRNRTTSAAPIGSQTLSKVSLDGASLPDGDVRVYRYISPGNLMDYILNTSRGSTSPYEDLINPLGLLFRDVATEGIAT
jgi:hypothetical protein